MKKARQVLPTPGGLSEDTSTLQISIYIIHTLFRIRQYQLLSLNISKEYSVSTDFYSKAVGYKDDR